VPATPRLQRGRDADAASGRRPQPRQAGWPAVPRRSARRPSPSPHQAPFSAYAAQLGVPMTIFSKLVQLLRRGMPTTRADLSQRCCRWVRSSGSPPVAFGAGFPALSHRLARPASARQRSACPFCGAAMGGVESPTPPHGGRLSGAVCELTPGQNGRHHRDTRGLDGGRPAWDICGIVGSGVVSTPRNCPGHGECADASGTHL
jgi:hypothetical protein